MADEKSPVDLWLEALESGGYTQTQGYLHDTIGWCCLGVACDVYQKQVGDLDVIEIDTWHFDDLGTLLPTKVMDWLGLDSDAGYYEGGALIESNDNGATFAEIAAIIRARPEGLFTDG